METQQQAPARALKEMAHINPSLPRVSALVDLFNQTWKKNGDLKGNSATASFTKLECGKLSLQWEDRHHPVCPTQMETEGDKMSSQMSH